MKTNSIQFGKYRLLQKLKKYKLNNLFAYNDVFHSILEYADEKDKIHLYRVNVKLRNFISKSKLCPIYYKFNADFFVNNISNQKVLDIYNQNRDVFKKILRSGFLRTYCSCTALRECRIESKKKNCMPCHIYNFNKFLGCCGIDNIYNTMREQISFFPDDGDTVDAGKFAYEAIDSYHVIYKGEYKNNNVRIPKEKKTQTRYRKTHR
ncbi:MAG: hypothetical protein Hyperionvirus3_165 [Hyperionvirus sp.]|uniref:Uncharacterized protein n=1 Tax=Hyperionvirus sp. TaxID=2487770 RepID=A0A3G5ACF2_9VIRU|nr:MAG: hypothetical protein Hyperionvirus3_165 [Hyperionvirus sp.]